MAWRFKVSKYKNSQPLVPKNDLWMCELSTGNVDGGYGVAASAAFAAFSQAGKGVGTVGIVPLEKIGRNSKALTHLRAHTANLTDLKFSPFNDGLLATCAQDGALKLWQYELSDSWNDGTSWDEVAAWNYSQELHGLSFHPMADTVLGFLCTSSLQIWDLQQENCLYEAEVCGDVGLDASWHPGGRVIAVTGRDRKARMIDPRSGKDGQVEMLCHGNSRDGRLAWLNSEHHLLTSGFSSGRIRQVSIWDVRNPSGAVKSCTFDGSGVLLPLVDGDTGMVFLVGKGDRSVMFVEAVEKDPWLTEPSWCHLEQPTRGACIIPKRAVKVMQAEVDRVLLLSPSSLVPITYQVPRKSYRDFHADIFPETVGPDPSMTAKQWWANGNVPAKKISLDPSQRDKNKDKVYRRWATGTSNEKIETTPPISRKSEMFNENEDLTNSNHESNQENIVENGNHVSVDIPKEKPAVKPKPLTTSETTNRNHVSSPPVNRKSECHTPKVLQRWLSETEGQRKDTSCSVPPRTPPVLQRYLSEVSPPKEQEPTRKNSDPKLRSKPAAEQQPEPTRKLTPPRSVAKTQAQTPRTIRKFGGHVSKFKHLFGSILRKEHHIENLPPLGFSLPPDTEPIQANSRFCVLSVRGAGGRLGVLDLNKPGRLADGVTPVLIRKNKVMDFRFNPFNDHHLAVGYDDGVVCLWEIPEHGLSESSSTPIKSWPAHSDKVTLLRYHPLAADLMLTASSDKSLCLWDLTDLNLISSIGLQDQAVSMQWSGCGRYLGVACRDGSLQVWSLRENLETPLHSGDWGNPLRTARLLWANNNKYLVVSGFSRQSERLVRVYSWDHLDSPLHTESMGTSPALLNLHLDEDTSTLFLIGKGDNTLYCYEVSEESPHFFALSHHHGKGYKGVCFLPKKVCDIRQVEFQRCLVVLPQSLQPLSFKLPRVKIEYFQDDVFPPTKVTWESLMSAQDWVSGKDASPKYMGLQPEDMEPVSFVTGSETPSTPGSKGDNLNANKSFTFLSEMCPDKKKLQKKVEQAISSMLEVDTTLEQDEMEGVDPSEWEDE